jgi:hypothetical protein
MAINALVLPHDDERFALKTPFDRDFVEALKLAIPAPYRESVLPAKAGSLSLACRQPTAGAVDRRHPQPQAH